MNSHKSNGLQHNVVIEGNLLKKKHEKKICFYLKFCKSQRHVDLINSLEYACPHDELDHLSCPRMLVSFVYLVLPRDMTYGYLNYTMILLSEHPLLSL